MPGVEATLSITLNAVGVRRPRHTIPTGGQGSRRPCRLLLNFEHARSGMQPADMRPRPRSAFLTVAVTGTPGELRGNIGEQIAAHHEPARHRKPASEQASLPIGVLRRLPRVASHPGGQGFESP